MIILAVAPLVVLVAMAAWRPILGLVAISILLPSYLWRFDLGGVPTTFLELALYAVALGTIMAWMLRRVSIERPRWSKTTWSLLIGWAIAWAVATLASPDLRAGAGALKAWWFDPMLYLALVTVIVRGPSEARAWFESMVLSGVIVSAAGLYQLAFVRSTLQEGRLSSFYAPVANFAAMFIAPILAMTLVALTQRLIRKSWWMFAGVMLAALAATLSYGGYLALAAGLVVVWLGLPPSVWKKRLPFVAIAVAIVGLLALSTTKNFSQHFAPDRSSGKVREQIWVVSWALTKEHPLLGLGPNQFEVAYRQTIPKYYFPPLEWDVAQPHELWLAIWLEIGLLGLLVALTGTIYAVRSMMRLARQPALRPFILVGLSGLAATIVHGFVDTPLLKNDLAILAVFIIAFPFIGRAVGQKTN